MVKAIAIIGVRLLALNWIILGSSVVVFLPYSEGVKAAPNIIYFSMIFFLGIMLWALSPKFVKFILPKEFNDHSDLELEVEDIVSAGSFLIGIYLFVTRFSSLVFDYIRHLETHPNYSFLDKFMVPTTLILIFSFFLIFGHKSIVARLFNIIRKADSKVFKVED